jgi:maleylacetoacetate isomerase
VERDEGTTAENMADKPALYSYWRSSSAWRVRLALGLLGVDYEYRAVHLVKDGGEQHKADYTDKNSFGLVPTLNIDGLELTESLAIFEYLHETSKIPGKAAAAGSGDGSLLPDDVAERAAARQVASAIATNIQPIQNLRVLQRAAAPGGEMEKKVEWANYWISSGFEALEKLLEKTTENGKSRFCVGNNVTMADCFLVPQVYNAIRWKVDVSKYPLISKITAECEALPLFKAAHPDAQPDAQP